MVLSRGFELGRVCVTSSYITKSLVREDAAACFICFPFKVFVVVIVDLTGVAAFHFP